MKNLWLWVRVTKHLLDESVRRMLVAAPQILVGYSGGLDSTLLLHVLASDPQLIDKLEVNMRATGNNVVNHFVSVMVYR